MSYGYRSAKYYLPAVVEGDYYSASEEQRKVDIIDSNLEEALYLMTDGSGCGVIAEGIYTGTFATNASIAYLSESKPLPVIEALINEIAVKTTTQVSWTGLLDNQTYYLYITLTETGTASSRQYGQVTTTSTLTSVVPANSILVATATTTASTITIDSSPAGKKVMTLLQGHIVDDTNPHGTSLTQTNLTVSSLLDTNVLVVTGSSVLSGLAFFHSGVTINENLRVNKGIDVNNQRITSLSTPVIGTDAVNKDYVDLYLSGISGISVLGSEKVKASATDLTAGYLDAKVKQSLIVDSEQIHLVGDITTPGDLQYYGTNESGIKGFHTLALGISGVTIDTGIDIEKNATPISSGATIVRFSGIGVNVSDLGGGRTLVNIPGATGGSGGGVSAVFEPVESVLIFSL